MHSEGGGELGRGESVSMALNCHVMSLARSSRTMRRAIRVATEPVMRRFGSARASGETT